MSLGILSSQFAKYEEALKKRQLPPAMNSGYAGTAGYYWNVIPAMISAQSGYGALSTATGVPVGTPSEESMEKVGGGVNGTGASDVPTGESVGGTAAY